MSPPIKPIAARDVEWQGWTEGSRFGERYRHLTSALLGDHYHVGVALEELEPGRQSSPAHYHIFEEEHVYILEGSLTVRMGTYSYEMKAGDYVCFPAGKQAGHCLINNSSATCRYVIVGENNPNEVAVYTDSSKVLVRSLGRRSILDLAAVRDYWYGEHTGSKETSPPPENAVTAIDSSLKLNPPISSDHVPWDEKGLAGSKEFGGRAKHLTFAAVGLDYRVGMRLESPAPGKRLAPKHYHMAEEEHVLILEGQVTLLLGDERYEMQAGDYVCFPAGQKVGHSFLNSGTAPCCYLSIGERNPNDVCVYPESNKVLIRALRGGESILDLAATRKYWDGEAT
ncbi:cupin [Steroidobacter agaridevorans]|uniref:Cupin n=1 Tax=Steroidobacter agaridevorans TaxID=2695856 RepID=A0A829YLQ0_9GAMM|nr:cupin domain-containing protein [Steroidobacter agaridevorans]GFE84364.1 cupin [Steroidobacter agaridevorans]